MLSRLLYIAIIILFVPICSNSQAIKNSGTISNTGTIKIKSGSTSGMPDTIRGRVEFLQNNQGQQDIPNITFEQLVIKGKSLKIVSNEKKDAGLNPKTLTANDSLIVADSAELTTTWGAINTADIHAKAAVNNATKISGQKELVLNNKTQSQDLIGAGKVSNLTIDNPKGVNVKGGGFTVTSSLKLNSGDLRNSQTENFAMADSTLIVRNDTNSIAYPPKLGKGLTVKYTGSAGVNSGNELPDTVKTIIADNLGGVTLVKNIIVDSSLSLSGNIYTETSSKKSTLYYAGASNPEFASPNAEIAGTITRNSLKYDGTPNYFNNKYTYLEFPDTISANGTKSLELRVKPNEASVNQNPNLHVRRTIELKAYDVNKQEITSGLNYNLGYGWRNSNPNSETGSLQISQIALMRFSPSGWQAIGVSSANNTDANGWAYGSALNINATGEFALGMPGGISLAIQAKVFLEGAYDTLRYMKNTLVKSAILPKTPPAILPYTLDPKRANIKVDVMPDSIVDWVVLEFRQDQDTAQTPDVFYKTALLTIDGDLVDLNGSKTLVISGDSSLKGGNYYIKVRHRNHLPAITEKTHLMTPSNILALDFSNSRTVLGTANAMQLLYDEKDPNKNKVFGLFAGDVNQDGVIDYKDQASMWNNRNFQAIYIPEDVDFSTFVNTKDFNVIWNNRGK